MANKTIRELIDDTLECLSMGSGAGVQSYAEGRIRRQLYQAYEDLVDEFHWYSIASRATYALDGITGVVTTDLTNIIRDYNDIYRIFLGEDIRPLPKLPLNVSRIDVNRRSYIPTNNPVTVFSIYPVDTTDSVTLEFLARSLYTEWEDDTYVVNFDGSLLTYKAAWEFATDDGTNPAMEEKFKNKFAKRFQILRKREIGPVIALDSATDTIPNDWFV